MQQFSIRQQVAWLTLIPLFIMAVSLESFFLHNRFSDLDQNLLERGRSIARQFAVSGEYGVFSNNQAFLQNIANGVLHQPDVRGVVVLNSSSETLVEAGEFSRLPKNVFTEMSLAASDYLVGQASIKQTAVGEDTNLLTPMRSNKEIVWIYQPIIPEQITLDDLNSKNPVATQKIGAVIVEMSKRRIEETKMRMLRVTVAVTSLLLGLFFIWYISAAAALPIRLASSVMQCRR